MLGVGEGYAGSGLGRACGMAIYCVGYVCGGVWVCVCVCGECVGGCVYVFQCLGVWVGVGGCGCVGVFYIFTHINCMCNVM